MWQNLDFPGEKLACLIEDEYTTGKRHQRRKQGLCLSWMWGAGSTWSWILKRCSLLHVLCLCRKAKKTPGPGRAWVCQVWFMTLYFSCYMKKMQFFFPWQSTLLFRFAKFWITSRSRLENWNLSSHVCACAWEEIKERGFSKEGSCVFLGFQFPSTRGTTAAEKMPLSKWNGSMSSS